ncbi:BCD family MFS transporter [Aurantiacibacter poecillastricola]|uniref:BCD family MFS transporter n=1 Tax=Aurantiacibacter poecillastricola TaxID=3064385 RepID=UPI00273DDF15|nr:BCD family MFS transporter [Aurantiacibacter sp. 219JJ12-13]MDP5260388.1 BCD family MFS transporter [Aurantiacibacter sp. 219JJ12-13]
MHRKTGEGLGWFAIIRLGAVQASIGMIVMLATSLLNRVMVVEYAMAAAIPAGLVAWHYAVQLSRPLWGHGSDLGRRRTPWVLGGMCVLGLGALLAVDATTMMAARPVLAFALAILAFTMIGAGVGAAGTSMLALLASGVVPQRRAAAAAVTWIMMVAGIVLAAGVAGALLDPFSEARLAVVSGGVVMAALALSWLAMFRLEARMVPLARHGAARDTAGFADAIRDILDDPEARRFTAFIFVSMLAYSMQDLILEPFAGLVFAMTPGQSTSLSGLQHGGVLLGMISSGIGGSAFAGRLPGELRHWIITGCLGSALALVGLATAARVGMPWPLEANVFALGFCNGLFAVAAIGAMMGLAGKGRKSREGIRMGVWGASQAIAFGLGGLIGALGVDIARRMQGQDGAAFQTIFAAEAALFVCAALLAGRATGRRSETGQTRMAGT